MTPADRETPTLQQYGRISLSLASWELFCMLDTAVLVRSWVSLKFTLAQTKTFLALQNRTVFQRSSFESPQYLGPLVAFYVGWVESGTSFSKQHSFAGGLVFHARFSEGPVVHSTTARSLQPVQYHIPDSVLYNRIETSLNFAVPPSELFFPCGSVSLP